MTNSGGCNEVLSRLCRIIDDSIPQFIDPELVALSEDNERQLLISLSKVLDQIRSWTTQPVGEKQGREGCNPHSEEHQCLTRIVANLVLFIFNYFLRLEPICFLNVNSHYVQHLVGNVFLAISEFLTAYGNNWDNFICLLCNCFELAICNAFAHSIRPSMSGSDHFRSILWDFSFLKSKLNNSSWNCMAGILGILRSITKFLKGEYHEELVGILLNSLSNFLLNVPWDFLNEAYKSGSEGHRTCPGEHPLLLTSDKEAEVNILFLGHLIQLLCSLVGLTGSLEAGSTQSRFAILDNVRDLVPRLLHWCLCEGWDRRHKHIRPYFQHKILMLMIRLCFHVQLDCLTLVHWLQLIHEYYQDLLLIPISQLECNQDDTLEDSPFLLSLFGQEVHHLSLRHLQRQAVFLLIRCSLSLIDMGLRKSTADLNCNCMRPNSSLASDLNAIKDCCAERKGLLEFYGWLQGQVPNIFAEDEMYQEKCIKFASSFIRLYKNEDDMLFEVLLQMFAIPLCGERLSLKEGVTCGDAGDDILFHLSSLFSPVLLFHVFLAELQYDHQLLLDYLISRDTGSKCAEYLLRCLRVVCDSWKLFVEFPVMGHVCQESCLNSRKRRKMFHRDFHKYCSTDPLQSQLALSSEQHQEEQELTGNFCARGPQFEDAKACLLSLKGSLRKLHKRELFPYNPEVLIRRLTRFEEFCNQQL